MSCFLGRKRHAPFDPARSLRATHRAAGCWANAADCGIIAGSLRSFPRGETDVPYYSSILDVCVPVQDVPASVRTFADVSDRYAADRPASHTWSRRSIASQHVANLVQEFPADDLRYLGDRVAVLDQAAIVRAIAGLEALFEALGSQPGRGARCSVYECSPGEVADASQLPEVAPVPEHLRDDEGESLRYAIAYLKAHLAVLRHAREHELHVLHGQSHDLDGTET